MVWRELEGESVPILIKRERWRDVLGRKDQAVRSGRQDTHIRKAPADKTHQHTCKHRLHANGVAGTSSASKSAHTHSHSHSHPQVSYESPLKSRKPAAVSKATSFLSTVVYKVLFWKSRAPVSKNGRHQFPRPWTKVDPVRATPIEL
jgi:hypothetical protein